MRRGSHHLRERRGGCRGLRQRRYYDGEECDQGDLDGETCASQAIAGGNLACGANRDFDTRGCYAARFVDNADGTITDNKTGLIWEKKVDLGGFADFSDPHDADDPYFWSGACSMRGGSS